MSVKIFQMAIKYTKISIWGPPKFAQIRFFGSKRNRLATLVQRKKSRFGRWKINRKKLLVVLTNRGMGRLLNMYKWYNTVLSNIILSNVVCLTLFGLTPFGLTLFGLTLFGLTLFGLTLFGLTSFCLTLFCLMLFGLMLFSLMTFWSNIVWSKFC
jgi:hypothetical protein